MKNKITFSISKNHYRDYKETVITKDWTLLAHHMARDCMCPVSVLNSEDRLGYDDKMYTSNNHRANRNIVKRGNLGIIDFEGSQKKYDELIAGMVDKKIWFLSLPSQSNLNDKKNRRAHIAYILSTPYSINVEAFKEQAKAFFDHIGYKWDTPDSGIDTKATFNASGYFSPTFQLKSDAKTKKIEKKYETVEQIEKDIDKNIDGKPYTPIEPSSIEPNKAGASGEAKKSKSKDVKQKNFDTNMVQVYRKGYKVKPTMSVPVASGGWTTMEEIAKELKTLGGEESNPIISGFGCPECHKDHGDDPTKTRYAFAGIDDNGVPFVMCDGSSHKAIYRIAETDVTVWRNTSVNGDSKYVILNDGRIHYTDSSIGSVLMNASSCADELNMTYDLGEINEITEMYDRGFTIRKHITETPSLALWYNPYIKAGLHVDRSIYNMVDEPSFNPEIAEPNPIVKLALGGFANDEVWNDIPVALIYLAYYMFHSRKIMAILFLVNPERGIGKSTWAIDIPKYYMNGLLGVMDTQAIENAWDDAKLGKRAVILEDIEDLSKAAKKKLVAILKSDATAGDTKLLNIKTKGQVKSFGHNTAGTTNHRNQIPLDGMYDRRLHVVDFKAVDDPRLVGAFDIKKPGAEKNMRNAVNYLYSIYTKCEAKMDDKLYSFLYNRTPETLAKRETAEDNLYVGHQIGLALQRSTTKDELEKKLTGIVNADGVGLLKSRMKEIYSNRKGEWVISANTLIDIYNLTKDEAKSMSHKQILYTLGLKGDMEIKNVNKKTTRAYTFFGKTDEKSQKHTINEVKNEINTSKEELKTLEKELKTLEK